MADDPELTVGLPDALAATRIPVAPASAALRSGPTAATGRVARLELGSAGADRPFRVLSALGRGGFGEVVLAEQTALGRSVAVKVLSDPDGAHREGFRREAILTARLEHPHIVPVHDAGDDFLVMKRLHGRTLHELIAAERELPARLEAGIDALIACADAVAFAHDQGVVHRDLKPANIMLGGPGEVWVLDWGLAHARGEPVEPERICAGTPAYLPPETARGEAAALEPAADAFLFGATLFHLLTGRPPWTGLTANALLDAADGRVPDPAATAPAAPPRLLGLCRQAMDPDPARRPDLAACAAALRAWRRSSRGEVAARIAMADGEHHLLAAAELAGAAAYERLEAARAAARRARGLDPHLEAAEGLLDRTQAALVRAACAAEDLELAGALAGRGEGPALAAARPLVEASRRGVAARGRQARRARVALAVAAILALGVGVWRLEAGRREAAAVVAVRRAQAAELVAAAPAAPADAAGFETAIAAGERAAGLDPDSAGASDLLARTRLAYARWALRHDDTALAEAQLPGVAAADRAALEREVASARDAHIQAIAAHRQALVAPLQTEALRAPAPDGDWAADGQYALLGTLALWHPAPGDGDGADLHRSLIDACAAAEAPWLRALAARLRCLRDDLGGTEAAMPQLLDQDRRVARTASAALAEVQESILEWRHLRLIGERSGERAWECDLGRTRGGNQICYIVFQQRKDELQRLIADRGWTPDLRNQVFELDDAWEVAEGGGDWAYELKPDDPMVAARIADADRDLHRLGWRFHQADNQGDRPAMEKQLERMAAVAPADPGACELRVLISSFYAANGSGDGLKAGAPVIRSLELAWRNTQAPELLTMLARWTYGLGDHEAARRMTIDALRRCRETGFQERCILDWLSSLCTDLGLTEEAWQVNRRSGLRPLHAEQRLREFAEDGLSNRAWKLLESSTALLLAQEPDNVRMACSHGEALIGQERLAEAAAFLDHYQAIQPLWDFYLMLARVRCLRGDTAEGMRMFHHVRIGRPRSDYVQEVQLQGPATAWLIGLAGDELVMLDDCFRSGNHQDDHAFRLARLLLSAGAPRQVFGTTAPASSGMATCGCLGQALDQLLLAIPELRERPFPGEDGRRMAQRCLYEAIRDAGGIPVAGLALARPGMWTALARRHAPDDPFVDACADALDAGITGDGRGFQTSLGTARRLLRRSEVSADLAWAVRALAEDVPEGAPRRQPWFSDRRWNSCHPLPDLHPDADLRERIATLWAAKLPDDLRDEAAARLAAVPLSDLPAEPALLELARRLPHSPAIAPGAKP